VQAGQGVQANYTSRQLRSTPAASGGSAGAYVANVGEGWFKA